MVRRFVMLCVTGTLLASACTPSTTPHTTVAETTSTTTTVVAAKPVPDDGFGRFVGQVAADLLLLEPQSITDLGAGGILGSTDSLLDDLSPATQQARMDVATMALASLGTIDMTSLSSDEKITAEILRWHLEDVAALHPFRDHAYPVNYITGYHAWFPEFMADIHPIVSIGDAEAYIDRLDASRLQMEQLAEAVRRSAANGLLPTQTGVDIAIWQISNTLGSASNHPLVTDLVERLEAAGIDEATTDDLRGRAAASVADSVLPGYEELLTAVRELDPRSDTAPGVVHLPQGTDYYAAILRHHVSSDISPDEAHQLGLSHVDRLRTEITSALGAAGYDVSGLGFARAVAQAAADAGTTTLGSDDDRSAFLTATENAIAESAALFEPMFETFPDTPLEVVRPRPGREGGSGAYYNPPPLDGSRPGRYYLSLAASEFPMQTYATTNVHEAIPGHHFQLALQRESRDLPLLQRALTFTGFAEGWGLYAERLASEAGAYDDDPLSDIGRLRMELLRAARVVVDTGIHALGWSRQESVNYLTDLGFETANAGAEVDRYIVWPGQAPAYLIGLLELLRLRDVARTALGPAFDLAEFHSEILRHGSVPLAVLPMVVENWIASKI